MNRWQIIKAWSNQGKFPAGNLNWHSVKTMSPSHNNMSNTIFVSKEVFLCSSFFSPNHEREEEEQQWNELSFGLTEQITKPFHDNEQS